ncbi:YlmH family RNA-binding protein [Marinisporobacter balticus]|uniref:RNA-binding protein YlmH n=1 Tax=Marinisporobacter balticus TaxID=2018667 RepID=A0A4R2KYJ4_9FIRM|nr:YlmH/Sll1252 family protein [Marinisporobacter balticus]TCO78963.1 RNA-binding protein YlmH [Marinisporobacter balticus]
MIDKELLTKNIKNNEERQWIMKTLSKVESVCKGHIIKYTDFYDPYQIAVCVPTLNQIVEVKYLIAGGYEQAERKVIIIYPEYMQVKKEDFPICAIRVTGKFEKNDLTHRDFLGAILNLGLKREKVGDILVRDGQADMIVSEELCDFIRMNLEKISKYRINIEQITFDALINVQEDFRLVCSTVASLRLDAIIGVGFGESRNAISKLISNDRVKVNFRPINQPSYTIAEGDLISFKGKGRIILDKIGNKTKKDKYQICIKRMI